MIHSQVIVRLCSVCVYIWQDPVNFMRKLLGNLSISLYNYPVYINVYVYAQCNRVDFSSAWTVATTKKLK